jgi:probable HAF family extracellular repeat protein
MMIGATGFASATTYTLTDLGPGAAFGINDAGQVVGVGGTTATIWNGTTPTPLGILPGQAGSVANAINNAGQVVGLSYNSGGTQQAVIWNGTIPTALGTLPGGTGSYATAINRNGLVAGVTQTAVVNTTIATKWNGTTPTALGTLVATCNGGGCVNEAHGINDAGQVVGISQIQTAVIWNGTIPTALTLAGSTSGIAFGINNNSQAVGLSRNSSGIGTAVMWDGTAATALGTLSYMLNAFANSINSAGVVVGYNTAPTQPGSLGVIWNGTTPISLSTLLDASGAGWTILEATAINNVGQIVGIGSHNGVGQNAVLLTPSSTLQVSPASNIAASGPMGGSFTPTSFSYKLSSTSGSVGYFISGIPTWLNASFTSGTVTTTPVAVTFSLMNVGSLNPGTYNATITFTNSTNGQGNTSRTAVLTVTFAGVVAQRPLLVMRYNPWLFSGRENMIESFLENLSSLMDDKKYTDKFPVLKNLKSDFDRIKEGPFNSEVQRGDFWR